MKSLRSFLAILLALIITLGMTVFSGAAGITDEPTDLVTGEPCGENVFYDIKSNGVLRVYGDGPLWFANHWENSVFPWAAPEYNGLITDVVVESGVTRLPYHAFSKMNAMRTLTLGDSAMDYSYYTVYDSTALTEINVSPENPHYTVHEGAMYSKDMTKLLLLPAKYAVENNCFKIPEGVTEIGDGACRHCWYIHVLYLPDSLLTVGKSAFYMCEMLSAIIFGKNLETIGSGAFQCNVRLTGLKLPDSVTTLGYGAFKACGSLRGVELGSGITRIERDTFYRCQKLFSVTFTKSMKTIASEAFLGCDVILDVWYDGGERQFNAIDIGDRNGSLLTATRHCTGEDIDPYAPVKLLEGVQIGDEVYYDFWSDGALNIYGRGPAYNNPDMFMPNNDVFYGTKRVTIESGVTFFPGLAFKHFGNTVSYSFPDTLTELTDANMIGRGSLEGFAVDPENPAFTSEEGVLYNKDMSLLISYPNMREGTVFTVPDTVKTIGDMAFNSNKNLEAVILQDGVETIGRSAFAYSSIAYIDFGNTVRHIGYTAFEGCRKLTEVILPDSVETAEEAAFGGCWLISAFAFGNGITEIPPHMLFGCSSLANVVIPAGVTSVGVSAFEGSWPTDVWYGGSQAEWDAIEIAKWNNTLLEAELHCAVPTEEPSTEEPTTQPTVEEPTTQPTVEEPTTQPTVEEPATQPSTDQPEENAGETFFARIANVFRNIYQFFARIFGRG